MKKNKKPSAELKHGGSRIKCIALLMKCAFAAIGYGLVWSGAVFSGHTFGISAILCGALIVFLSAVLFIINPLSKTVGRK